MLNLALLCYASKAGKTLSIMLASWNGLCIYIYMCSVCVSDNDSAIVESTQPTELNFEHLLCPILEKLSPQI